MGWRLEVVGCELEVGGYGLWDFAHLGFEKWLMVDFLTNSPKKKFIIN